MKEIGGTNGARQIMLRANFGDFFSTLNSVVLVATCFDRVDICAPHDYDTRKMMKCNDEEFEA